MPSSQCSSFQDAIGPWMEGERSPALQAHLHGCASCRALVSDLQAIHSMAQEFPEPEAPPRVWAAIHSQIEAEAIPAWRRWFAFGWPRPVLATATLAVLIVGAFVVGKDVRESQRAKENQASWTLHAIAPTVSIQKPLDSENDAIHKIVIHPADANAVVEASFQKNLDVVDNYIKLCEKSVREDPQNELARDYLYGAYQQKADLLAEMSERGDNQQ